MGSAVNIFVSYSHEDESYRQDLVKYFDTMVRNKEIEAWTDRDIKAGAEWRKEISSSIDSASVFILLVSPDFMHSYYCIDVEMKEALAKQASNNAVVVPIFVRRTDVHGSPISEIHCLPTGRKPISTWADKDEAWFDVIAGLRKTLSDLKGKEVVIKTSPVLSLSNPHQIWLGDTEVSLVHRLKTKVKLGDVYIPPDFTILNNDFNSKVRRTASYKRIIDGNQHTVITGEEQAGKTSLVKFLIGQMLLKGDFPVYVSGRDVKSSDINALVGRRVSEQYDNFQGDYSVVGNNTVIIIDDFHLNGLNRKHLDLLLLNLKLKFYRVIILARDTFRYVMHDIESFEGFDVLYIRDFGNVKRTQLIEKWVSLGVEESIDERELYKECDDISLKLNAIIRKKLIPSKPIFIISILQMLEAYTPQRLDMTSHGHCYQSLVYQALEKMSIKSSDIDRYINVLTEIAWAQYNNDGSPLVCSRLEDFFDQYDRVYLKVDRKKIKEDLIDSSLLVEVDGDISFKYPYIYYFFAAKKIADSFRNDEGVKREITKLLDGLHREDYANIIIFITHHTKESWILDEIQVSLMSLFVDHKSATLEAKDLGFLEEFLKDIPRLIIEEREVQKERMKHQQGLDDNQEIETNSRSGDEHLDSNSLFANINKVFKSAELIGQIVRNRHASLSRDEMTHLLKEANGCGLRFLQFFIELSDLAKGEVLSTISQQVKDNPLQTNIAIEKEAKSAFLLFTFSAIYAVIKKIASSTGCAEAEEIFSLIEQEMPTPAIKLINQAITLDFHKRIDFKKLSDLVAEFKGNAVCDRILKEIVVQHVYMFPVDYKDKQKISSCLSVPIEKLQLQDLNKDSKMLEVSNS